MRTAVEEPMPPSPRPRRVHTLLDAVLLIGLVAAVGVGGIVLYRTAAPRASVVSPSPLPGSSMPQSSASARQPETPIYVQACGQRVTDVKVVNEVASMIVRGTVTHVPPPRWSTPDGTRPRNPHARERVGFIYRPVTIDVEQYLKGEQPDQTLLVIAAGGTVGQDTFDYCGDPIFTFQEGEQVVLFLYPHDAHASPIGDAPPGGPRTMEIAEHYTITDDGQALNIQRQVPMQQLLDEIQAAHHP